jgi:hypothetical protein
MFFSIKSSQQQFFMKINALVLLLFSSFLLTAQNLSNPGKVPFTRDELKDHLMYIAADELAGRKTASPGSDMAAEYIALQFEKSGVKKVPGQTSWYQRIPFNSVNPPKSSKLKVGDKEYTFGESFVVVNGGPLQANVAAVFVNHGWVDGEKGIDDYKNLDVKGKLVFALPGSQEGANPMEMFNAMGKKRELAMAKGAIGIVELFRVNFPWRFFRGFFERQRLDIASDAADGAVDKFYHAWLNESVPNPVTAIEKGEKVKVEIDNSGLSSERLYSSNVVGFIQGTDEKLKAEHIILSAHYDHIGTSQPGSPGYNPQDTIFNGARDNGLGTVAIIAAAKTLALSPPKRSVLIIALTGEEMGLLGSNYYVKNPWLPLDKAAFNLNTDGAGYNSTKDVSIIGWGRTNADDIIEKSATEYGLGIIPNPAPNQNLYDRSDNVAFANVGIPAVNFAPGMTDMDDAINKYYHKTADNPETVDFDYLFSLCRAYVTAAQGVANANELKWTPGDVYDKRGRQ